MKINLKQILPALAVFTLLFSACGLRGDGDLVTEIRPVEDFNALEIGVNGDVDVRVDSVFRLEVTGEENIMPYLETLVDNDGTLKIFFNRDVWDVDDLHIVVSAPAWYAFEVNGSADVDVPDAISGNQLKLGISGSGDINLFDINFNQINARVSGSGNLRMSGAADNLKCAVSGSGDVDALGCPVLTADVSVSGSGNVRVHASELLDVTISGSGDVEYKGSPQINSQIAGSGRLRKI
ncbi:MAG: DUF2807 domain-containing protein [Saprospiraceae bacterium]|nr:DUF2807 domain-containing protein [Saprospiraceae bacterium]